jgi:hypothetical protein
MDCMNLGKSMRLAALGGAGLTLCSVAQADFFADSKGDVELRNVYFNRDFRQSGARDKADEWAQGFIFHLQSGYTPGVVGFGVDALGMVGYKLDSSDSHAGTGLLPANQRGGSQDQYGKLGLTAKAKISKTEFKVGTLFFRDPVVSSNDTRLVPQTFRGALVTSQDLANFSLIGGHIDRIKANSSTDFTDMSANRIGGVSNDFSFGGGDYRATPNLTLSARYAKLENIYQQYYGGLVYNLGLGNGQSLKSDLRFSTSHDDGTFAHLDNQAMGGLFTYKIGSQAFAAGFQKMNGESPYPYMTGSDPYLVNFIQIGDFANIHERSWQVRYDYDFSQLGIPGLTFMTRYVNGDNVERASGGEGKEWERNMDIAYVVQSGPLKNFGIKWRNATVRSNFGNDLDENRLILSYTLALW